MLTQTYIGQPVTLGKGEDKIYFRITQLVGTFINTDKGKLHSKVLITTPGGNTLESGNFHLNHATKIDIEKLVEFEQKHLTDHPDKPLYDGLLTEDQIKTYPPLTLVK